MVSLRIELPDDFLDDEVRNGYTITKQMKEVWAIQIDLLKKLEEVCGKHGLRYFADSGTLIGAVRDGGYIPWDDDIDVVMLREDYNKLIEVATQEFKEPYFLQNTYSDIMYIRGHSQLRNSLTTGSILADVNKPFNRGIFIDIFPLDNIPDDLKERKKFIRGVKSRWFFLDIGTKKLSEFRTLKGKAANVVLKIFVSLIGYKRLFKKYEEYCSKYNNIRTSKLSYIAYSRGKEKHFWPSECFEKCEKRIFEFTHIYIPAGYDERLKIEYGEYMIPMQKPTSHGKCIFETQVSYMDIL